MRPTSARRSLFLVVTGPGGTGKTTVIRRLIERDVTMGYVRNLTTRERRPPDPSSGVDDDDWFEFVEPRAFHDMIVAGKFAQWVMPEKGYASGTPLEPLLEAVGAGQDLIFDFTPQLAINLARRFPDEVVIVGLVPPTFEELIRRITERGDPPRSIELKRRMAAQDLAFLDINDYVVMNDIPDLAVQAIEAIALAERHRPARQRPVIDELAKHARESMLFYYDPWDMRLRDVADQRD